MKRYNIAVKKTYTKNGEEKSFWPSVGTLTHFPAGNGKEEGFKLELPIFGATQFYVFEIKPKTDAPKATPVASDVQPPSEELNPDDIPF